MIFSSYLLISTPILITSPLPASLAPFLFADRFLFGNTAHFTLGYKTAFFADRSQFTALRHFFTKSTEQLLL